MLVIFISVMRVVSMLLGCYFYFLFFIGLFWDVEILGDEF